MPSTKTRSSRNEKGPAIKALGKCPTGIAGLDEVTGGGLPLGRPTLICGAAGSGKSLLAMEFLMRGIKEFDEPGVLMTFEESGKDIAQNVASLGFDVAEMIAQKKLLIDYVRVNKNEIEETGEYDLEGLFIRLNHAIDSIGARRVVLDTIESLFGGFTNQAILRSELRRLFTWLKDKGVTAVITGEKGEATLTRQGLEEYVSDCVIFLDHRVNDQVSTRRLRVVKYRGSTHGTNEYPFLIDEGGINVLPITSLALNHRVTEERISSGVAKLDSMLGGKGYYRGSSILLSGTSGTGKSSVAAHFVNAACARGERCVYFAFEEAPAQIIRNMASIGINLGQWTDKKLLHFHSTRPTLFGLETHLAMMHKLVQEVNPKVVVIDPISNLTSAGSELEARTMLLRLVDFLKSRGITALFVHLTSGEQVLEGTDLSVSSLMDTWLLLRDIEYNGERNRAMYVLKSRGMAHSNQVREFVISSDGIDLIEAYVGPGGVLTGSSRLSQVAKEKADALARENEIQQKRRELERRRAVLDAQIAGLRLEFEAYEQDITRIMSQEHERENLLIQDAKEMSRSRKADLVIADPKMTVRSRNQKKKGAMDATNQNGKSQRRRTSAGRI